MTIEIIEHKVKDKVKESGNEVIAKVKPQVKQPSLYQIIMHNDDYTPMEFVVAILESFFHMDRTKAIQVMYEVHMTGKAVCGIFSKDIAETKADQVIDYARTHEHPLLCSVESI